MPDPSAAAPWTVTLAWTPDQNGGAVATYPGRAPLHAVMGLLRAGEPVDAVAAEHGLSGEEVAVLDRLRHEIGDEPHPAVQREPVDLDTLIGWVEQALESSAIEVDVWETDQAGSRAALSVEPLRRLTRCLRSAGLLDEYDDD